MLRQLLFLSALGLAAPYTLTPSSLSSKLQLRSSAITASAGRSAPQLLGTSMILAQKPDSPTATKVPTAAPGDNKVRPPTGLIDLLTRYSWGQQDPGLDLPHGIAEGSPPQPQFCVTDEMLTTLNRDGVVHVPNVLSEEWVEYLREATEWQIKNPHIWAVPGVASGLYDYIQRSAWTTNTAFAKFMYYSPVASVLGKMSECGWFPEGDERGYHEIRISTDLLMVNPNKGFKWHQDNQNGPLTSGHGGKLDALRFWVTLDDTPAEYGAPVYLKGSHNNEYVGKDEVFVNLDDGDLPEYAERVQEFRPKAGDMIIWHPRSIHKVDGAPGGVWGDKKRRVLGGTVAIDDAKYQGKKKALFSDMGSHNLQQGDDLKSPYFPIIYPQSDPEERAIRDKGEVGRSVEGFFRMVKSLFTTENIEQFSSWTQVVQGARKIKEVNEPFVGDKPPSR